MKTIRNASSRPLSVPLPGGKKLYLGPGREGQIADTAAEHPPLASLLEAKELELVETGRKRSAAAAGGSRAQEDTGGHHPALKQGRRGDR